MTVEPASTRANRINSDSLDWSYIGISFTVGHSTSRGVRGGNPRLIAAPQPALEPQVDIEELLLENTVRKQQHEGEGGQRGADDDHHVAQISARRRRHQMPRKEQREDELPDVVHAEGDSESSRLPSWSGPVTNCGRLVG